MTPKRVLHAHSTFSPGGKELRSVRLINAFGAAARHSILSAMPGKMGAAAGLDPGIDVDFPAEAPALTGRPGLARYRALAAYMRRFDLVLTYNWGAMDMVAARRLFPAGCPPLIHHEDGFNADEAQTRLWRRTLFRRLVLPAATHLVVPSETLRQIARTEWKLPDSRIHLIPNGIAVGQFGQLPNPQAIPGFEKRAGDIVIGTVAGLRAVKNIPRLVQAAAQADAAVRVVVVGDGPERAAILATAQSLGIADRVHLPGHLPNPQHYLGLFDVFALSSDSEQAPIAMLEAMAAGLPVVATDVGDVRHILPVENHPYVVGRDDRAGFARALADLCANPALRRQLGAANQRRVRQDFDIAEMIRRYGTLYGLADPGAASAR